MIDKVLDLVPSWVYAIAIFVLVLFSGGCYVRMKAAQADLANYQADVAKNTAEAEARVRAEEQAKRKNVERIANDQFKKATELQARADGAAAAAGSLRDEINRLNASPAPANPESAAFALQARTARELLGACTERYKGVAQDADGLRDQVSGLQDFATSTCSAGK